MAIKKYAPKLVGLAVFVFLFAGFGSSAHASANYWIRYQEATDPGYQSAVRGGWYDSDDYGYLRNPYRPSYAPYSGSAYDGYEYSYQYQYQYQYRQPQSYGYQPYGYGYQQPYYAPAPPAPRPFWMFW